MKHKDLSLATIMKSLSDAKRQEIMHLAKVERELMAIDLDDFSREELYGLIHQLKYEFLDKIKQSNGLWKSIYELEEMRPKQVTNIIQIVAKKD